MDPNAASFNLGAPQTFNRYAYVLNNPMNSVDPDGEFAVVAVAIGIAIGGVLFGPSAANAPESADTEMIPSELLPLDVMAAEAAMGPPGEFVGGLLSKFFRRLFRRGGTAARGGFKPLGRELTEDVRHVGPQPTQLDVNPGIVDDFASRLQAGERLDPIDVVELPDGRQFILDGHHRFVASERTGIPVEIRIQKAPGPVGFNWNEVLFRDFTPDIDQ